jgi:hypothetical protein
MTFSSLLRSFVFNKSIKNYIYKSIKNYISRHILHYSKSYSELYYTQMTKKILKFFILFCLIPSHLISKTIVSITNRELK